MDLIASFSSQQVHAFHFFKITGLINNQIMNFLFDSGAAYSIVGINHLVKAGDVKNKERVIDRMRQGFIEEARVQGISERKEKLRAANNEPIITYPCVCHNVSIEGSAAIDFYFDFSLTEINLPLLGGSFMNDCSYSHPVGGSVIVSGMTDRPGTEMYRGLHVVDFRKMTDRII